MTTKRKVGGQGRRKPAVPRAEPVDDDIALADELLRAADQEQGAIVAEWKKFMKKLGIRGKPIGAKKLREMAIREGIDPEGNEFSRGIIEMPEE